MRKNDGFTLVELIAVVVILGLIALVVAPAVMGVIRGSKEDVKSVNIDTILNAAYDYSQKFVEIIPSSIDGKEGELVCAEELIYCGFIKDDIESQVEGFRKSSFKITYCNSKDTAACKVENSKYFGNYLFTYVENSNQVCEVENYRCSKSTSSNDN